MMARPDMSELNQHETEKTSGTLSLAGRVLVVTGLSGAGRTTALKVLEDMDCEAVDNLPVRLLPNLVRQGPASGRGLAIGVDVRTRDFRADAFAREIEALRDTATGPLELLFLDSDDDVIERRYTETRRVHPMASDRPLADGIAAERRLLSPLRETADIVIDSSRTNIHEFARILRDRLVGAPSGEANVLVTSFSYRNGVPRDADMVIDVRFLRNPHYEPDLRPLTGQDAGVGHFIEQDPDFDAFMTRLIDLFSLLLPRFNEEGKSYLTIAIGCTGGRHRSVYVAERLRSWFAGRTAQVEVRHRELSFDPDQVEVRS
jgi:UPF0042 nucleotide-binding protein